MNETEYLKQIYRIHSGVVPAAARMKYAREMVELRRKYSWVQMVQRPQITSNYL